MTQKQTGEAVLSEIQQWIWHLDLHVTEHDLTHAGKALRAAWPQVRKHFVDLEKEQKAVIADLAMMIRRLDMALGHSNARHPIREQAKGLLQRNNLNGSILRDEYTEGTKHD